MFYKNLIINKHFQGLIKNNIKKNKVPHALLLYGNNGTGKEGHAIELAAILNCKSKINYEACGHCHSCIQLKSMQQVGSFPDTLGIDFYRFFMDFC